jgi:selenide,water dikinase
MAMATLNRRASEIMLLVNAHAATDVTGFGLAGHLKEMIKEELGVEVYTDKLPQFPEAAELAAQGFLPSGFYKNKDFYTHCVEAQGEGFLYDLIYDPQSSGGLLMAVSEDDKDRFENESSRVFLDYWVIGRFVKEPKGKILAI